MLSCKRLKSSSGIVFASFVFVVLLSFVLAACGSSSTTTGSSGSSGSTPTATSSSSGGGRYGNPSPTTGSSVTPTATTGGSGALIHTATATIKGTAETILTNAQGMTLYYRTSDTATSVCSGGCASAWPPLLANGSSTPTSSASLPGKLSIVTDANGSQVAYNGHVLYTFSGDTAADQTNGEGFAGIWFVVPTSLK